MDIVLSWSGPQSRAICTELHAWLPEAIPDVSVWMSDEDISKGKSWFAQLMEQLGKAKACIICVTPENLRAPWIYFEAGAIASKVDDSYVFPFLVGTSPSDLKDTPLSQYQCTLFDKKDVWKLVKDINKSLGDKFHHETLLKKSYEAEWSPFYNRVAEIEARGSQLPQAEKLPYTTDLIPTQEEIEILLRASKTADGLILVENYELGLEINIAGERLNETGQGRAARRWDEAVERLTECGLLKRQGYDGSFYSLSSKGYKAADQIRVQMESEWDAGGLRGFETMMRLLFAEMRADLTGNPSLRDVAILDNKVTDQLGGTVLVYARDEYPGLESMIGKLEEEKLLISIPSNIGKKYKISEEFAHYLMESQPPDET